MLFSKSAFPKKVFWKIVSYIIGRQDLENKLEYGI